MLPSTVTAVQPSASTCTSGLPALTMGSMAITMPSRSFMPHPLRQSSAPADLRACGRRCHGPQNPLPPKNPASNFCTAEPTSPSVAPGFTTAMPPAGTLVTVSSRAVWGRSVPTGTVMAASPQKPSTTTPKSTQTMSPSFRIRFGDGMPCTTSLLTEVHSTQG